MVEFQPRNRSSSFPACWATAGPSTAHSSTESTASDGVFLDLVYLSRPVRERIVFLDDDYQLPAVARTASFFLTNLGWTLDETSPECGFHHWAVLHTARVPHERPFDYHIDF